MKKQDGKQRKLNLSRETLQPLDTQALDEVNGGIIWTIVPISVSITLLVCGSNQAR